MAALLTEDALAERFAAQIRAANTATQRAFAAVLDPLLGAVDLTVIAEHLAEDAAEKFGTASRISPGSRLEASCILVFPIDQFFTERFVASNEVHGLSHAAGSMRLTEASPASHTLFVHTEGRLVRASLDEDTEELTEDEEEGLLALQKQKRTQFSRFLAQLQTAFPSAEVTTALKRDFPDYLGEQRHVFYGAEPEVAEEFWHLDVQIQMPVVTGRMMERLAAVAVKGRVRSVEVDDSADAEVAGGAGAGAGAGAGDM